MFDEKFYVTAEELNLKFNHGSGKRLLSYKNASLKPEQWRKQCKQKLSELLALELPVSFGTVFELRSSSIDGVTIIALTMDINEELSIPAYLLLPENIKNNEKAVIAIHGHGTVESCIGAFDDYHHSFALNLARNGHIVLCPELRGFGILKNLAEQSQDARLDYWDWGKYMAFSLVTDGFLYGKSIIGETVHDLLRWEKWLALKRNIKSFDIVGISYGGDLALIYPVYSFLVDRIFASGTLGSFSAVFSRCYNAPAHCIPGILNWMDRSDIAALNAPRPLAIHFGELDKPGPENNSASYNETVPESLQELNKIYKDFNAESKAQLIVSKGKKHEMDNDLLLQFLKRAE